MDGEAAAAKAPRLRGTLPNHKGFEPKCLQTDAIYDRRTQKIEDDDQERELHMCIYIYTYIHTPEIASERMRIFVRKPDLSMAAIPS